MKTIYQFSAVLLIFVASLSTTSCDNLFDEQPKDKLVGTPMWGDALLLDEYINPWYRNMSDGFYVYMPTNGLLKSLGREYLPWYTDQITVSKPTWYSTSYGDILKGVDTEITQRAYQYWNAAYGQIHNINILFENADNITTSTKDRVMGEAHFMRAYYYYNLWRRFGGVLLIDKDYNTLKDTTRYARASYDDMVNFIVKEADEAAKLLPINYNDALSSVGRATKGAALMLKAKTYLWASSQHFQNQDKSYLGFTDNRRQEMLQLAAQTYEALFALNAYQLLPLSGNSQDEIKDAYRKIFLTKNSAESIFEVQHNDDGDYSTGWGHRLDFIAAAPYFGGTDAAHTPTQNHVDEYGMRDGKTLDPDHPYENRDYRFYANILYDGAIYRGHEMDIHYTVKDGKEVAGVDLTKYGSSETAAFTKTGYYLGKFVNPATEISNNDTKGSSQNYIIWRYAEALLDYAEIQMALGNNDVALANLNLIRQRAKMPLYDHIDWNNYFNERRVELAFEESVYWDLLRWNMAEERMNGLSTPLRMVKIVKDGNTTTYTYGNVNSRPGRVRLFKAKQYYWPLPWDEVRYQRIEQNPEWKEV